MSFLGKNYTYVKHENFDAFLKSVGLPDDKIEALLKSTPSQKLVQDGDSYKYITNGAEGTKEITFTPAVEFDDVIGPNKVPIRTTYVVDGNAVTQIVKAAMGTAIINKVYNGDDLVVTITSDLFNGVAKTYYKA